MEQLFSKLAKQVNAARDHMTDWNYAVEAKVVADWTSTEADAVCALAQQCWSETYGPPRRPCADRIDAGVARKRKDNTETAFLEKRRRCIEDQAELLPVETVRQAARQHSAELDGDALVQVNVELDFQRTKFMRNQVEAYLEGTLLSSEVPANMQETARAFRDREVANAARRHKDEARQLQLMTPVPAAIDWASVKVYRADEQWSLPRTLTPVARPCYASCFVEADPASPEQEVLWYAALGGGHVVSVDYVQSLGTRGVCFSYGAAVLTKRLVFIDPDVARDDPAIVEALRHACARPFSKWRLLRAWEDFASATDAVAGEHLPRRQRRDKEVLALTTDARALALNRGNVCTKNSFLPRVWRVACTSRGLCGT